MKKLFLFLLSGLITLNFYAQINVGKSKSSVNIYVSDHNDQTFDNLKRVLLALLYQMV